MQENPKKTFRRHSVVDCEDNFFFKEANLSYRDKERVPIEIPLLKSKTIDNRASDPEMTDKTRKTFTRENENVKCCYTCKDRSNASYWSCLFFNYINPLLDQSLHLKLNLQMMGELPDHLKVTHEIRDLEANLEIVLRQCPNSRFTVVRAILKTHP